MPSHDGDSCEGREVPACSQGRAGDVVQRTLTRPIAHWKSHSVEPTQIFSVKRAHLRLDASVGCRSRSVGAGLWGGGEMPKPKFYQA